MFLRTISITPDSFIPDIVRQDYRTAKVFRKHEIGFCCGGKWPLSTACEIRGLDFLVIKTELERSTQVIQLSNFTRFDEWTIDFLTDYIINIHHRYLRDALPGIKEQLDHFAESHRQKYPYVDEAVKQFNYIYNEFLAHTAKEEEILFPYIRQIAHAYDSKEPYASLLVRTLRKPVEAVMHHEHELIAKTLQRLRELTDNYTAPPKACVSHGVIFSLLKELDNDLVQHLYLENQILFPKAIAMEKELLLNR
jgi:regulator of cell morphogenesis and NO signaling